MLDIAIGRGCHFCGDRDARNERLRRAAGDGAAEDLTLPLCGRHRLLLDSGARGRLHKPTGVRWWLLGGDGEPVSGAAATAGGSLGAMTVAGCPAGALLGGDARPVTGPDQQRGRS